MGKITINGISIDPENEAAQLDSMDLLSEDSSKSNYILVQTTQPLNAAQKAELSNLGAQIIEYVPEATYVCYYESTDLKAIRKLPFVKWANTYMEGFKLAADLRSPSQNAGHANLLTLGPTETSMSQETVEVRVVLHRNVPADAVRQKVAEAAKLDPATLKVGKDAITLTVQRQHLDDLSKIDEVHHIEKRYIPKLHNSVASNIMRAPLTHSQAGFEGANQVIAICDTGFDKGSTSDVHPAFANRVVKLYSLGRPTANDPHGHGTHVSGSVLGDGFSASMDGIIRGTAPLAKLVLQSVLDANGGLGGLPDDLNDLFDVPYQNDGARVHTNSWGSAAAGRYTTECRNVDEFVWSHRDMVICFSAGNEGEDADGNGRIDAGSIGSPGAAKNCVTVGASESDRAAISKRYGEPWPSSFPVNPIASDRWADNPNGMAAFSSRGPTSDGRIKPDVVAPGTAILSAHSRNAHVGSFWGLSNDPLFCFMGGTSMATPLVAGCVAVIREFFQKQQPPVDPSAALVKAMLINGATDLAGQYVPTEAGNVPNLSEGFGRVDLANCAGPLDPNVAIQFQDEATVLDTGDEETLTVSVDSTHSALKVTLVWTDPAGEALQNDLDLIVRSTDDGTERHGNMAADSDEFDRWNNVEQVLWPGLLPGNYEIVVRAFRVAVNPQSYAMVIRLS